MNHAEVLFANFLVEHDLSFNIADHASKLFTKMFPDSTLASGFQCGRTKATALVKEVLGPTAKQTVSRPGPGPRTSLTFGLQCYIL